MNLAMNETITNACLFVIYDRKPNTITERTYVLDKYIYVFILNTSVNKDK